MAKIRKKEMTEDAVLAAKEKFASGNYKQIAEKCNGCDRIIALDDSRYCSTYAFPAAKWKTGICNFATHVRPEIVTSTFKINPLKASKRAVARRK